MAACEVDPAALSIVSLVGLVGLLGFVGIGANHKQAGHSSSGIDRAGEALAPGPPRRGLSQDDRIALRRLNLSDDVMSLPVIMRRPFQKRIRLLAVN